MKIENIGIVGLGLIGGSLAKAIASNTRYRVYATDINSNSLTQAINGKVVESALNETNLIECDVLIVCLYPNDTINFVKENAKFLKKSALIVDCSGVKKIVCDELSDFCTDMGLKFIGGHPMAGREKSGYEHTYSHLFDGATMLLCKEASTDLDALICIEKLFLEIGFGGITLTTPTEHDRIIAFTSQLAHVVSNAYVQSDTAKLRLGFSAGSYQDMTRVAYLNENMWSELFIANKKELSKEIKLLAKRLEDYAELIDKNDEEGLKSILRRGKEMKEGIG